MDKHNKPADQGLLIGQELEYVSFYAYKINQGESILFNTRSNECAIVILSGICNIESEAGKWEEIGRRMDIFEGIPPYVLFLPRYTEYRVTSLTGVHFAVALSPSQRDIPSRLVTPKEITREARGSGNRLRYVNRLKPKDCDSKIILFEVYSPGGNWSSFPPHKHDCEDPPRENLLEEFYYYQFKPEKGFALHWNSNDDLTLDDARSVRNGDLVPVPKGYHTVVTAPGYEGYYLNAMAGPTDNWNFTVHPHHAHLQDY